MGNGKHKAARGQAVARAPKARTPEARDRLVAVRSGEATDRSHWAVEASWSLLVAALVASPLLMTNLSWLPVAHAPIWLHSGPSALKALTAQALVGLSLACFCVALVQRRAVLRFHRVGWLAAAFLGWAGVTVLTSVSPATAFVGYTANSEGWMTLLTYGAAAFLTLQLADEPSRIRALLRATSLTAAAVAVYGLIQTFGFDPLKWQILQWGAFRSFGTLGNPDLFGAYMVLNLFVLVALLLGESDARWRMLYALASLAVGAATFTSLTRAAWIGVVPGAIVFAVVAVRLKPKITRAEKILALALVAVVAGAAVLSLPNGDADSNVARRFAAAFDPSDKNTLGRTETWRIAAVAIGKRPIIGYGPDTFPLAFEPNKTETFARLVAPDIVQANAHSAPIQLATESGVPGALLWLALLGAVAALAVPLVMKPDAKGAESRLLLGGAFASVAGYVAASFLSPSSPPLGLLLWATLACLVSPSATRVEAGRARTPVAVASIVVGALAAVVALTFLFADTRSAIADDETAAVPARLAAADLAMRLDPLSAEDAAVAAKAYAQAALQDAGAPAPDPALVRERLAAAGSAMDRAVALEPTDPHRRSTLVSLLLIRGAKVDPRYDAEAVTVAAATVRDAPNDLEASYWYGRALLAAGRPSEAVPVLERALKLRPGYADAALVLSDLYVARGDAAAARVLLERTIPVADNAAVLQTRLERLGGKATGQ